MAAKFAAQAVDTRSRRAVVKARSVVNEKANRRSTRMHLDYVERDGVSRDGERGRLYSADLDTVDRDAFEERIADDRHHFRFIVSPEDAHAIGDLKPYTRALMTRVERDLGTHLDWVAVDHWDTDNPHTHILLRGKDDRGADLVIAREYVVQGMRDRARELATDWLGPRREIEIRESLLREVRQERWTSLDEQIKAARRSPYIDVRRDSQNVPGSFARSLQIGRLQYLQEMGLAHQVETGLWSVVPTAESALRSMGERGDIIRTVQRAFGAERREHAIFDASRSPEVTGRVVSKGLLDELHDRAYLVVDGIDGRAHFVALAPNVAPDQYPVGSIIQAGRPGPRATDRAIAQLSQGGIYRVAEHLQHARRHERDPEGFVQVHVRRLEALRRERIVERLEEGVWSVPSDLSVQGHAFDARRNPGAVVHLRTHLPVERQVRAIGATWLDHQLLKPSESLGAQGFGIAVRDALAGRQAFLIEQGLATRQGQRIVLARDLLATLRARELDAVAKATERETGLMYRAAEDGERISGTYRQSLQLVSGRFAMVDDGLGFTLVPWRPVVEQRLGQAVSAVVRGQSVSWEWGRSRGLSL